jgi:hypothetical protein
MDYVFPWYIQLLQVVLYGVTGDFHAPVYGLFPITGDYQVPINRVVSNYAGVIIRIDIGIRNRIGIEMGIGVGFIYIEATFWDRFCSLFAIKRVSDLPS